MKEKKMEITIQGLGFRGLILNPKPCFFIIWDERLPCLGLDPAQTVLAQLKFLTFVRPQG